MGELATLASPYPLASVAFARILESTRKPWGTSTAETTAYFICERDTSTKKAAFVECGLVSVLGSKCYLRRFSTACAPLLFCPSALGPDWFSIWDFARSMNPSAESVSLIWLDRATAVSDWMPWDSAMMD